MKKHTAPDLDAPFEEIVEWARGYILIAIGKGTYAKAVWEVMKYLQIIEEEKRNAAGKW